MIHPSTFPQIQFAVRSATAFIGQSFSSKDEEIVRQLTEFFSKLGVVCVSGKGSEPTSVSDKVRRRIKEAEFFIGIFTRRELQEDGSFSTSSWVVEEKAVAFAEGKKILIFIEDGVKSFGGIQGDHEYIRFNRDNFGKSLIQAIDYVLAITSVPLKSRVEGNNIHFTLGDPKSVEESLVQLRRSRETRPQDLSIRLALASALNQSGDLNSAMKELEHARTDFSNNSQVYHQLGHQYEVMGDSKKSVSHFEKALDLNTADPNNYKCLAKALYAQSKSVTKTSAKKPILEKAKRLLEQAKGFAPQQLLPELDRELFLVQEALTESKQSKPLNAD